ncbi:MAG: hypothetical protein IJV65_00580 [Kiritimatiellae bacterium]|nr:hypothetical protein [Kiritimatiellia bacterium]
MTTTRPALRIRSAVAGWGGRHRRALRRGALGALALWFFWYPADRRDLYVAMPHDSVAAAYVRGVAAEDDALYSHPLFAAAFEALGLDPERAKRHNAGVYWTLYWLTGEHGVAALVPAEGACGDVDFYLAAASYVGWKARALEFLWRVKQVPFLGPLKTTERGTRYMEFPHARELDERGIVLGLDIVDGVLVAVLACDPDRVVEVAERVRDAGRTAPAPLFAAAGSPEPWRETAPLRHRVWCAGLPEFGVPRARFELGSLRGPGLELHGELFDVPNPWAGATPLGGQPRIGPDVADETVAGCAVFAAGDVSPLLPWLREAVPDAAPGLGWAWLADEPYTGLASVLRVPSAGVAFPVATDFDAAAWWASSWPRLKDAGGDLKLRERAGADGARLVWSKKFAFFGGDAPEEACAFFSPLPETPGKPRRVAIGSSYGAWRAMREAPGESFAGAVAKWISGRPPAVGVPDAALAARIDFDRVDEVLLRASGVAGLAQRFGAELPVAAADLLPWARPAAAAVRALGLARFDLLPPPHVSFRFRAAGPAPDGR